MAFINRCNLNTVTLNVCNCKYFQGFLYGNLKHTLSYKDVSYNNIFLISMDLMVVVHILKFSHSQSKEFPSFMISIFYFTFRIDWILIQ